MDKKFIKVLIEEGTPICDLAPEKALTILNNEIMTVYVMNGLHRSMQPESFKEEVRACAATMYKEFTTDRLYKSIRDKELSYIFSNGMKGRLGTDKDIVLTCKSLLRWVEGYITHAERKQAMSDYIDDKAPKPAQLPRHELTDEEIKQKVTDAWADYVGYKRSKCLHVEKDGTFETVRTIGDAISMPITCLDYGRIRLDYLVRNGYASETDSLVNVFERAYRNEGRFEKVK